MLYTPETGNVHITLVTPDPMAMNYPKAWVLNQMANKVETQATLKIDPNSSDTKLETSNNDYQKLMTGNRLTKDDGNKEGNISCI